MDSETVARRIIAEARANHSTTPVEDGGGSADAFDFMIKTEGIAPRGELYQAAYRIANEQYPIGPATTDEAQLDHQGTVRRDRAVALWERVLPHLEAYAEECRTARFSGWSRESGGPVRRVRG